MDGVIPEALRKHLHPRRSVAGTAHPRSAEQVARWVAATYPKKRDGGTKTNAKIFEAGLASKKDTSLLAPRTRAHALLLKLDRAALAATDLETLAVAERVAKHLSPEGSLASAIAEARGLADAVEVCLAAEHLTTDHDGGYPNAVLIVKAVGPQRRLRLPSLPLRHLLCAAPEKDYVEARRRAEALRKGGTLDDRAFLSFVFPDEPWANEDLAAALDPAVNDLRLSFLFGAATDPALIRRWTEDKSAHPLATFALDLATVLGARDAIPIFAMAIPKLLVKPAYGAVLKTPPRQVAQAIGCYDTKEAAEALAAYATSSILGPLVLDWFHDHPKHGAVLEALARGKGKLEVTASRVLGKRKEAVKTAPVAKASDIPSILRDMPWRPAKGKRRGPEIVVDGLEVQGLSLERIAIVPNPSGRRKDPKNVRAMTKAEVTAWEKEASRSKLVFADYEQLRLGSGGWEYPRVPDREGLQVWNEKQAYLRGSALAWVEAHGLAMIPGLIHDKRDLVGRLKWEGTEEYFDAARSLVSPRVAPTIAAVVARRKQFRRLAIGWLLEHAEVAAFGLVRDAVSAPREPRAHAESALAMLARHGKSDLIRKAAKAYGKEAQRAIESLLTRDPLAIDVAPPKRPPFLRLPELPQVTLRKGGNALDESALSALVEMLQVTSLADPYPGLSPVREACDDASLGALALELLEQWVIGDAPGRHEWMLMATVHFRSEKGTRRLAELAREWARKNLAKAERACTALAAEGSDLALMHLGHIAATTRFVALRTSASELLRDAAAARGLTDDELGDRTVPDAGLGPRGDVTLSYGSRELVVTLDSSLRPVVREKTKAGLGAPASTLPRPTKSDDAAKAKQAREAFDQLKKDLEAIAKRQIARFERAMVNGRLWSAADFEALILAHPVLLPVARALVWEMVPAKGATRAFRVAEDGSRADAKDHALAIVAKAHVRLAHPARTPDLGQTWSTVFGDYQILQPFEQLGRATYVPTSAERTVKELTRGSGIMAPARKLLGAMESRGWERNDSGHISAWIRGVPLDDGTLVTARWPIAPGISIDETLAHAPDVTTKALVIDDDKGRSLAFGVLDPVAFSEIVRDIEAVRLLRL